MNSISTQNICRLVLLLATCSGTLVAQWSFKGNHIYNTNAGIVAVGTASPSYNNVFQVRVGTDQNFGIRTYAGETVLETVTDAGNLEVPLTFYSTKFSFMGVPSTNLLVGTTVSTGGKVEISESADRPQLRLTNTSAKRSWTFYAFYDNNFYLNNAGGTRFSVTDEGNVGIGVPNPTRKLEVSGDVSLQGSIFNPFVAISGTGDAPGGHTNITAQGSQRALYLAAGSGYVWIRPDGNVGIGTTNPGTYKLAVNGTARVKEVVVTTQGWPDFVFEEDYRLTPLAEVEMFTKANKRLPDLPSAKQVSAEGVMIGEMQARLLQKVEELTLYIIELEKKNKSLEARIARLEK